MSETNTRPRLQQRYLEEVRAGVMERHGITNVHAAPRVVKVVVSMGVGEARENKAMMEAAVNDLQTVTGQKASIRKARKSVSNFKLREGMEIGCMVTLRGDRMWEFLDRLIAVAIPRIKDFRGLPNKLDGRGNYSMGLADQSVFPEINLDRIKHQQGMNITIVTTAQSDAIGTDLLTQIGLPFERDEEQKAA